LVLVSMQVSTEMNIPVFQSSFISTSHALYLQL